MADRLRYWGARLADWRHLHARPVWREQDVDDALALRADWGERLFWEHLARTVVWLPWWRAYPGSGPSRHFVVRAAVAVWLVFTSVATAAGVDITPDMRWLPDLFAPL